MQSRINIIRSLSSPSQWYFVPGIVNPADIGTRSIMKNVKLDYWFKGPEFLATIDILVQPNCFSLNDEEIIMNNIVNFNNEVLLPTLNMNRFSKYHCLLNTVTRIFVVTEKTNGTIF